MRSTNLLSTFAIIVKSSALSTFLIVSVITQAQYTSSRLYTTNDGLPGSYTFGVYEDSKGYLWAGGSNGISRFDGKSFVNYGLSNGLPAVFGSIFLEDSRHRIWAGTTGGVALLKGNRFATFPVNDGRDVNYVFNVVEKRDHQIWALTSVGIYQFEDTIWNKVNLYPGWESHPCRQLIENDSGLYVNFGHLLMFRNKSGKWEQLGSDNSEGPFFDNIREYGDEIILTTRSGISSIKGNKLTPILRWPEGEGYYSILIDSKNRLWYGKTNGTGTALHVSYPGYWNHVEKKIQNRYGLIVVITEDSRGTFWIGTQFGLLRIQETAFSAIDESNILNGGGAESAVVLADSGILLSSSKRYLYHSPRNEKFLLKDVGGTNIDAFTLDDNYRGWFVTRNRKLYRISNKELLDFTHLLKNFPIEYLLACEYDPGRKKLFVSEKSCLFIGDENELRPFIPSNTGVPIGSCGKLLITRSGILLASMEKYELYKIDKNDRLEKLGMKVGEMMEDREGDIWIVGENTGLRQCRFDSKGSLNLIRRYTEDDGLQSNSITAMTLDSLGRVWVESVTGIDILQKDANQQWKVFNFSKNLGLQISWGSGKLVTDRMGNVWATTFHDLFKFESRNSEFKSEVPKVVIDKVQVNSTDVDWSKISDSLDKYGELPVEPKFSFNRNTINIFFNGISYSAVPRLEYSWQLNSGDTSWSIPSPNSSVSFVNFRPGKYRFKVRVRDLASPWSEPAEFSFTILAPFWMRGWFISLCSLILVATVYGVYRYRINQLKKMLSMRTKISRDLHDEVGSTLTSINILSKVSRNQLSKDQSRASELLQKITEQSENMQQSMSDIVWSIKPDNDRMENLLIRMREYLNQTAEAKGLEVELNADEKALKDQLSMQQRRNVFLIFKEAVNNSVKYSKAGRINVFLGKKGSHIRLTIEDNGVGFEQNGASSSNGLKNMQSRANELEAKLEIQSSPGKGTQITLFCPTT